jgi:hypothetical protein
MLGLRSRAVSLALLLMASAIIPGAADARPLLPIERGLIRDCPTPGNAKVVRAGTFELVIVRCETTGDAEFSAVLVKTGRRTVRQSFPVFEDGVLQADSVNIEAHRSRRMSALRWNTRAGELIGEISAGCGGGTEYRYRLIGERLRLIRQRQRGSCDAPHWRDVYRAR